MGQIALGEEGIAKVRELTGGHGTRAVLEAVGHMPAYDMAIGTVRPGGVVNRVKVPQYEDAPVGFGSLLGPNITLTGGPAPVRAYVERLLPAVLDGTVGLERTAEGYRAMDRPRGAQGPHHSLIVTGQVELKGTVMACPTWR
ncbi:hypothetical protein [Streptomyces sp. NRRL S-15]|uniref:hypothetical protein n=1 Tax=Streptomyces sp. NRRL S-15 TaxID=1463886 RepID=UPI000B218ADA|nr:hypothetical protein [Streptomyces sp. NRRL S-15]